MRNSRVGAAWMAALAMVASLAPLAPSVAFADPPPVISTNTNGKTGNGGSFAPSYSPDGRYVAFLTAATNLGERLKGGPGWKIFVVIKDLETGGVSRQLTARANRHSIGLSGLAWTLDSTRLSLLFHEAPHRVGVYVIDIRSKSHTRVASYRLPGKPFFFDSDPPRWSPDGSKLAYGTFGALKVRDTSTGESWTVPTPSGATVWDGVGSPRWIGNEVLLFKGDRTRMSGSYPYTFHLGEAGSRRVSGVSAEPGSWLAVAEPSPSGGEIALAYGPVGPNGLHNLATGQFRRLPSLSMASSATWAPSGRVLAVDDASGRRARIVGVDLESGSHTTLVRYPKGWNSAWQEYSWSPDGAWMAVERPGKGQRPSQIVSVRVPDHLR